MAGIMHRRGALWSDTRKRELAILLYGAIAIFSPSTASWATSMKFFFVACDIMCRSNADIAIYAADTDGRNVVKLTTVPGDGNGGIGVSLDRSKIAFMSTRLGPELLYTMNSDGSGQTQVPGTQPSDSTPSWSPDGLQLAFNANAQIYAMNLDGTNRRSITNNGRDNQGAAWSPDGSQIAYCSRQSTGDACALWFMNADGSNQRQITSAEASGAWSPDGKKLAFSTHRDIFTVDADGSDLMQITHGGPSPSAPPQWTPDGEGILFQSFHDGFNIWKINADGTNQMQLTHFIGGVIPVEPVPEPEPPTPTPEPPIPTPEPSTGVLFGSVVAGLLVYRWYIKKRR
ncbi:MAG: DPP IV N-terminal domain-containing protein [bacterium]|nr:DPP IV N-terminal domain-containing protein [bacterium]MDZ4299502.1 DPP IV N-terminal domain-containing protein [Candidatus Sungbacteria bacterium]